MPIVEGGPFSFVDKEYVIDALPHEDGILWMTTGARVTYWFQWHESFEEPGDIPWPFLEIRKVVTDDTGAAHSCSSFVPGCSVFGSFNGRSVYSKSSFLDRFDDTDVQPLTELTQVYCDSRDVIVFQFHEGSWTEPGRFVAHFEKHSGAHIRLIKAGYLEFLEIRMACFDDRVSGEHIDLEEPVFADIKLDLWRTVHHARTAEEYLTWHATNIVEPTFQAPLVFSRSSEIGEPDSKVRFLAERWTPDRARDLVGEEIRKLVDES